MTMRPSPNLRRLLVERGRGGQVAARLLNQREVVQRARVARMPTADLA
jgi:hypothetical protein